MIIFIDSVNNNCSSTYKTKATQVTGHGPIIGMCSCVFLK
jgi:hypothetical protein